MEDMEKKYRQAIFNRNISLNTIFSIFACISTILLIMLRDITGAAVNRYIFVAIALVSSVFMDIENCIAYMFFLMPLFNGLPGNYMRVVLLAAILIKRKSPKVQKIAFLSCMALCILEFMHIQAFSEVSNYVFWAISLLFVGMVANDCLEYIDEKKCILLFAISTALAFLVIFIVTYKMGYLELILYGRYRFGDFSDFAPAYITSMHLTLDPNFLGLYCIVSVMSVYVLVAYNKVKKSIALPIIVVDLIWGIVSLSRTFLILCVLFVIMAIYCERKNAKHFLYGIIFITLTGIALYAAVAHFFPTAITSLERRMNGADMAGGNGRVELSGIYLSRFADNYRMWLLGSGGITMIDNMGMPHGMNLHCTPLEVIVGGGILGTLLTLAFIYTTLKNIRTIGRHGEKFTNYGLAMLLIIFVYYATLPSVANTAQYFPLLVCVAVLLISKNSLEGENSNG